MRWFLLACLLLVAPASAQPVAPQPAAAAPALSPQQAQRALELLRDPARRDQFIALLEALARVAPQAAAAPTAAPRTPAAPGAAAPVEDTSAADSGPSTPLAATPAAPPAPAPAAAVPLAPDSLGAQVIVGVSERLATLSDEVVEAVQTVTSFPLIVLWVVQLAG